MISLVGSFRYKTSQKKRKKITNVCFFHSSMNHQNINLKAYNLFIVQKTSTLETLNVMKNETKQRTITYMYLLVLHNQCSLKPAPPSQTFKRQYPASSQSIDTNFMRFPLRNWVGDWVEWLENIGNDRQLEAVWNSTQLDLILSVDVDTMA